VTTSCLRPLGVRVYIVQGDIAIRHRRLTEQLVIEEGPGGAENLFNDDKTGHSRQTAHTSRGRYAMHLTMEKGATGPTHRKLCLLTSELHSIVPALHHLQPTDETVLISSTRYIKMKQRYSDFNPVFTQLLHEDMPSDDIPNMADALIGMFSTSGMSTFDVLDDTGASPIVRRVPLWAGDDWGTLFTCRGNTVHRGSSLGLDCVEMNEPQWPPQGGQELWWKRQKVVSSFQMDIRTHFYSTDPRLAYKPGDFNGVTGDPLRHESANKRASTVVSMESCMQWDRDSALFRQLGTVHSHPQVPPELCQSLGYPTVEIQPWYHRLLHELNAWTVA
jgi:hypothetical protein